MSCCILELLSQRRYVTSPISWSSKGPKWCALGLGGYPRVSRHFLTRFDQSTKKVQFGIPSWDHIIVERPVSPKESSMIGRFGSTVLVGKSFVCQPMQRKECVKNVFVNFSATLGKKYKTGQWASQNNRLSAKEGRVQFEVSFEVSSKLTSQQRLLSFVDHGKLPVGSRRSTTAAVQYCTPLQAA